jgi:hypothetical protein
MGPSRLYSGIIPALREDRLKILAQTHRKKPVRLATMTSSNSGRIFKRTKDPPPWRKPEHVELAEELRDLERDIAKHSASQTSEGGDEQPGMQESQAPQTGNPVSSSTRRRLTRRRLRKAFMTKPAPPSTSTNVEHRSSASLEDSVSRSQSQHRCAHFFYFLYYF